MLPGCRRIANSFADWDFIAESIYYKELDDLALSAPCLIVENYGQLYLTMIQRLSMGHDVTVFRAYPFEIGQKIRIEGGGRKGDWLVIGVSEDKVTLQCPISLREFSWPKFCYQVGEEHGVEWPQKD